MLKFKLALAGAALCLLPLAAIPASAKAAKTHVRAAAKMYECTKCHMKVSAAVAKKDHFRDPMDGGKLVPVKAAK